MNASLTNTPRRDSIRREEYTSHERLRQEMEHLWPRVWNIGGWFRELQETGDFVTHSIGAESLVFVRQADGCVKGFFNVCQHRGNRLLHVEGGHVKQLVCSYHGWRYDLDGRLVWVQDPDDFPQGGNPCGRRNLVEVAVEVFAGFIWYRMETVGPSLKEFLGELWDIYASYRMDQMVRVYHRVCEVPFNWKNLHDNFCESYHLPATHPQLAEYFEDDYRNTTFELFPTGHSNMRMKGGLTSPRAPDPTKIYPTLEYEMQQWGLDPQQYVGRIGEIRAALQAQIRKQGPARGLEFVAGLADDQLTDAYHTNLFPATSITAVLNFVTFQRAEPHPTDPGKAIYENWMLIHPKDGQTTVMMEDGSTLPVAEAAREVVEFGKTSFGPTVDQDLSVATTQQLGLTSRGFREALLTGQEDRVHQFHDTINDYLNARR